MRRFIRKIAAAGASVAMVGMTLGGAVAADLSDLPEPFVKSGAYVSTAMVIGDTQDTSARSTLKTYFDGKTDDSVAGLGDRLDSQEVKLQDNIAASGNLNTKYDDSDSSIFKDSSVSIGGTSYNFHTELQLLSTADKLDVETSLTSSDEKYEDDPKLELRKDGFKYCYVFDEHINMSGVISSSNPFDMEFLGRSFRVNSIGSNTSFTIEVGDTWTGHPGEVYSGNGITMEVISVDSSDAIVDFGNDQRTISEGSTVSEGTIDVYLDTAVAGVGTADEAVATFIIGEDAVKTYSDAGAFPKWCSPADGHGDPDCDEDDPDWVWDIKGLQAGSLTSGASGSFNSICVENDFEAKNYNDDPAGVGEYYGLPYGFAYVGIDDLTVADSSYMTVELEYQKDYDLSDALTGVSAGRVVHLWSSVDEGLTLDFSNFNETSSVFTADTETENIYLWANESVGDDEIFIFYIDSDNNLQHAGNVTVNNNTAALDFGYISYDRTDTTDVKLSLHGNWTADDSFWVGFFPTNTTSASDNLWFRVQTDIDKTDSTNQGYFEGFGDQDNSESDEVLWGDTISPTAASGADSATQINFVGDSDYKQRTGYGIILESTDTGGDADEFTLKIPNDQLKANVAIYEGGGSTSTSAAILDTTASTSGYTNLILVGGPCVNSLTAEFMGLTFPSCEEASTIAADKAVIQMVTKGSQTALIVAGWERADTQRAATEVSGEGLTGTSMIV